MADPLIKLEVGGVAPVLRYDIPEPTSYEGKNFIALTFEEDVFLPVAQDMPSVVAFKALQALPRDDLRSDIARYVRTGITDNDAIGAMPSGTAARNLARSGPSGRLNPTAAPGSALVSGQPMPPGEPPPDPPDDDEVVDGLVADVLKGIRLVKGVLVDGTPTVDPIPVPAVADPHLYLVESVRLTSFLGDYGAGRIVKTFSLLPGEKTRISVRSFLQRESTRKAASSVLDSLTQESASDLETSVSREQSDQSTLETTKEYYAEGEASASWGWGSAKAKAGTKGSTNAAREESVKNVANATEKHTARASAKREVEVNTSYEESSRSEDETVIEREIENINLSRTLNFVFRQMNQKFVTMLHLTDVRIAFFNGDRASRREVPLSRLDDLLEEVVAEDKRAMVREVIREQLEAVRDEQGTPRSVVREIALSPDDTYLQFDPTLEASVTDDSGREFTVPGVLLHRSDLVMRTEGVIVEALLGNGDALDAYATEMQQIESDRRRAEIAMSTARAARVALVNEAIASGDDAAVDRAERLGRECCDHDASPGHA